MRELALLFLRLGLTAFGGPAAHIALMHQEVVARRNWLTPQEFLDLSAATNLIPGPNSTELAIFIGQKLHGARGLIVSGACFILPSALIVGALAWLYVRFGTTPQAAGILYGIKPVMMAVIAQALWSLGRQVLDGAWPVAVFAGCALAVWLGVNELLTLLFAGAISLVRGLRFRAAVLPSVGLLPLFLFFLKVGSVLFGSGYVLLAFLRADLVERWGWLTEAQLLEAVSVGQFTPGPVLTTATFIGYVLAGAPGAIVATIGIFLPAFCFVALSGPVIARLAGSAYGRAFLDGLNVASLALMAVVSVQLGRTAMVDWVAVVIAAVSFYLVFHGRMNSAWLVLGGAVIGALRHAYLPRT